MSIKYQCSPSAINQVLNKMKKHGIIANKAEFNAAAPDQLRKEVTYRDQDFLLRLGRTSEIETVDSITEFMTEKGIIPKNSSYDKKLFQTVRDRIHNNFEIPWTSISPVMERLLFMLSSIKQPQNVFAAGIFCGNTLIWNVAPGLEENGVYPFKKVYGVDIDGKAIEIARKNFDALNYDFQIDLICDDALKIAENIDHEIDYVYLDADNLERRKKLYLDILKILYPKIKSGGWILAHDINQWSFKQDFREYKEFVRDKRNFSESISFDIDPYGLELSIK